LEKLTGLRRDGGSGIFGEKIRHEFPGIAVLLLGTPNLSRPKQTLPREFGQVIVVEVDLLIVGDSQIQRIERRFAHTLFELRRGEFFSVKTL
jgi:hypothetical protein